MMINRTSLVPCADLMPRSAQVTEPSGAPAPRQGAFFGLPEIGDEVTFQRSATHHSERGYVRSRMFGTRAIEIIDCRGKPLRLEAGQYRITNDMPHQTRGRQSLSAPPTGAGGDTKTFDCLRWPDCGCPDGTMRADCPGLKAIEQNEDSDAFSR